MKSKPLLWTLGAALGLVVLSYLVFFRHVTPLPTAAAGPGPGEPDHPPAVVETAPVEQGSFVVRSQFVGTLRATSQADLYARTPGPLVAVLADTGDRVRAGQLLARIDDSEERQKLEQARAAQRMAEATLAQRRAALKIAQATALRTEALFAENLVPEQQRDTAQAELTSASANVELARAQLEQARANLSGAGVELDKTRIIAPFSGFVGKRHLDLGAFAAANRPVFTVVDLSTIKTTVPLTERDATHVKVGQAAKVTADAFAGRTFEGRVARIASIFDPATHTTEAEVEVANPSALLKPGMFATVAIDFATDPDALLVPKEAVVESEDSTYVFVAEKADAPAAGSAAPGWKARRVPIGTLGDGAAGDTAKVAVEGQLSPGERVITLGQSELSDGSPVTVGDGGSELPPRPGL